jgi:hypothetical protein
MGCSSPAFHIDSEIHPELHDMLVVVSRPSVAERG